MKSGVYKVSFEVELTNPANEEEAHLSIVEMLSDMVNENTLSEANLKLTLINGVDSEYTTEEDEVPELNFG